MELAQQLRDLAEEQLESFARDWQRSPYYWRTEADIQREVSARILIALRNEGLDWRKHELPSAMELEEAPWLEGQPFRCRLVNGYAYYTGGRTAAGQPERIHPDIIVWDDLPESFRHLDPPPDGRYADKDSGGRNWPIAWVCEIKAKRDPTLADMGNLRKLLARDEEWGRAAFACYMEFGGVSRPGESSFKKQVGSTTDGNRLHTFFVRAPHPTE